MDRRLTSGAHADSSATCSGVSGDVKHKCICPVYCTLPRVAKSFKICFTFSSVGCKKYNAGMASRSRGNIIFSSANTPASIRSYIRQQLDNTRDDTASTTSTSAASSLLLNATSIISVSKRCASVRRSVLVLVVLESGMVTNVMTDAL